MAKAEGRLSFEVKGRAARDVARHLASHAATSSHGAIASHVATAWHAATASPIAFAAATFVVVGAVSGLRQSVAPADVITARHVLVFEDHSRSMTLVAGSLPATEKWMQEELAPLAAYGVTLSAPILVDGFGVNQTGVNNFLYALTSAALPPDVDAVYLFSDFHSPGSVVADVDRNDDEGLRALRGFLRAHHLRLYLRTVLNQPDPRLLAIAHESGGDFIGEP